MAETVRAALADATRRITLISPTPRIDAELLMAHALDVPRNDMVMSRLDDDEPTSFAALVERRLLQEPIAAITGLRGFWTIDLEVGPGAFIPRADTETLIEAAVEHFAGRAPATILDLGTGPGTLLLAALDQWPEARGLGIERSPEAMAYALRNVERLDFGRRAEVRSGIWGEGVEGRFDLILTNPPYVATADPLPPEVLLYEPGIALFGGVDGLDAYREIAPQLPGLLAPGGAACIEIGWTQAAAVTELLESAGLDVAKRLDLGRRDRCLVATA